MNRIALTLRICFAAGLCASCASDDPASEPVDAGDTVVAPYPGPKGGSGASAGAKAPVAGSGGSAAGAHATLPDADAGEPQRTTTLQLEPAPDGSLCGFSDDHRHLQITVRNHGKATSPATAVELATLSTDRTVRATSEPLAADKKQTLSFERGPVAAYGDSIRFRVTIDPEGASVTQEGECTDLRARVFAAMPVLQGWYDQNSGLYQNAWWTGANMLETTIDYTRETGQDAYFSTIDNTFAKVKDGSYMGFVNFLNEYYDDEGWWALAWIKAFDLTHDSKYLDMAKVIFADMTKGWVDSHCGGGLYWRKTDNIKNAIPNELFLTVAARLYLRTSGQEGAGSFLEWAEKEWAWFQASGMIQADSQIVDGMDRDNCKPGGPAYTYNQGVILGGLVDLWRAKGDATLLDTAEAIARAAIAHQSTPDGILIDAVCDPRCDDGDGVQFKGIFARNLAYLYQVRPLELFRSYLIKQSDVIWHLDRSAKNELGKRFAGPFDSASPSRQSSALDALLAAVRVAHPNLALGSTVMGSAPCTDTQTANLSVDGSMHSKWCAGGTGGQNLQLDLQAVYDVVGFRVRHAAAGGEEKVWNTRDFELETSEDGQAWSNALTVRNNTDDVTLRDVPLRRARHVRLHVTKAQTATDFLASRIYELEVLGLSR